MTKNCRRKIEVNFHELGEDQIGWLVCSTTTSSMEYVSRHTYFADCERPRNNGGIAMNNTLMPNSVIERMISLYELVEAEVIALIH